MECASGGSINIVANEREKSMSLTSSVGSTATLMLIFPSYAALPFHFLSRALHHLPNLPISSV